jgi:DNA-binding NarL/FixJ family response regulator
VRVVAEGGALLAPEVTTRLITEFARQRRSIAETDAVERLTERETAVLVLIARGLTNAEIAEHSVITQYTVKSHVNRLFAKLHLRDRAQAVILA